MKIRFAFFKLFLLLLVVATTSSCSLLSTKLTQKNYTDYLKLRVEVEDDDCDDLWWYETINNEEIRVYQHLFLHCKVRGASSNFNYNDVQLKLKITMTCKGFDYSSHSYQEKVIEDVIDIDTDIAGNSDPFTKEYSFDGFGVNDDYVDVKYELVDIHGSVSKAK